MMTQDIRQQQGSDQSQSGAPGQEAGWPQPGLTTAGAKQQQQAETQVRRRIIDLASI
jgi:hypothetical protein